MLQQSQPEAITGNNFETFLDPSFTPSIEDSYRLDGSVVSVQSAEYADANAGLKIVFQGIRDDGKVATFETGSFYDQVSEDGSVEKHDICVSTAGGCTRDCEFCSVPKADLGFERLLTADEMILQTLFSMKLRNQDEEVPDVVGFMGNGEPPDNPATIDAAVRLSSLGLNIKKITISTIGEHIVNIGKMANSFEHTRTPIGLQFSLHSADEPTRRKLIPGKLPLAASLKAVDGFSEQTGVKSKFNVVLMRGIEEFEGVSNLGLEQARRVAGLLLAPSFASGQPLERKLKISVYNEIPGVHFIGPNKEQMQEYLATLEEEGVSDIQLFVGSGRGIDEGDGSGGFACGQLRATTQSASTKVPITKKPIDVHEEVEASENEAEKAKWLSGRVLYVSGEHAAGKSSLVAACELQGYNMVDMGPILTHLFEKRANGLSWKDWILHEESQHGETFVADLIASHVQSLPDAPNGTIIVGPRSTKVISKFEEILKPTDSKILYITASFEKMHLRYKLREGKELSKAEFEEKLAYDADLGVKEVLKDATITISNDTEMSDAVIEILEMLNRWNDKTN